MVSGCGSRLDLGRLELIEMRLLEKNASSLNYFGIPVVCADVCIQTIKPFDTIKQCLLFALDSSYCTAACTLEFENSLRNFITHQVTQLFQSFSVFVGQAIPQAIGMACAKHTDSSCQVHLSLVPKILLNALGKTATNSLLASKT